MAKEHGGARPGAGRKPGKISEAKMDLAKRAAEKGEEALGVLVDVMLDEKAPHAARISAASAILDRGFGKPQQKIEHSGGLKIERIVVDFAGNDGGADGQ